MTPKKGHHFDQRDGTTFLQAKAEGIEIVNPGKGRLQGDLITAFQYPRESERKMEGDFFCQGHIVREIMEIASNCDRIV